MDKTKAEYVGPRRGENTRGKGGEKAVTETRGRMENDAYWWAAVRSRKTRESRLSVGPGEVLDEVCIDISAVNLR